MTGSQTKSIHELKDEFKKNYDAKQNQWRMEDIQQETIEKMEKERRKETKMFLNQIKKRPRFTQLYVDDYSKREENTNKNIVELNKMLGKQLYDKKRLNKKIDEFLYNIEKMNENEPKEKSNLKDEEESKSRIEVLNKLIRNLNEEKDEEYPFKFGERENEIVISLVKENRFNEKSPDQKKIDEYKLFQEFKDKVINKSRYTKSDSPLKKQTIRKSGTIRDRSNKSNKSSQNVIAENDMPKSRRLSQFKSLKSSDILVKSNNSNKKGNNL